MNWLRVFKRFCTVVIVFIAMLGLRLAVHNLLHGGFTSEQDLGSDQAARDPIVELSGLNSEQAYLRDFKSHSDRLNLLLEETETRWKAVQRIFSTLWTTQALLHETDSIYPTPITPAEMKNIWNSQQQISKLLDIRPSTRDLGKAIVAEQDALLALVGLMGRSVPKEHANILKELQELLNEGRSEMSEVVDDLGSLETELRELLDLLASTQA
ncbi:MAG: hypothetical protein Q9192_006150 [Flavoplaca navasiana]